MSKTIKDKSVVNIIVLQHNLQASHKIARIIHKHIKLLWIWLWFPVGKHHEAFWIVVSVTQETKIWNPDRF